jgi:5-methylcytosine-specific restriction endonuclease McrA
MTQKEINQERRKTVKKQARKRHKRAHFGPRMKAAPVIVKTLDGQVVKKVRKRGELVPVSDKPSYLDVMAQAIGFKTYEAYLQSPHWKRLRRRVLERDQCRCRRCNSKTRLQIHHLTYIRIGKELLEDLLTLCNDCHKRAHNIPDKPRRRCQARS